MWGMTIGGEVQAHLLVDNDKMLLAGHVNRRREFAQPKDTSVRRLIATVHAARIVQSMMID